MDRPYVSLSNLETFWIAAKQYIDAMSGGASPELMQTVQDLVTNLNNEITTREEADIEINRLISAINEYTINGNKVSLSPTLNGDEIPYSSDTDDVSVYDKVNSIDQDVSSIKSGYVKSVKGEGVNIDVTPTTSSNGDVTIKVDATSLKNRVDAIDGYTVNSKQISSNPTLTGNDITLGVSVGDDTNYPTTKTVTSSIQTLRETIAGLGRVMELKGILDELPSDTTNYENGDVVIVGNKEYVCYNSLWYLLGDVSELSQDVSTIKSSYVKSITCEGANGVTVTPITASNGDVSIKVDASTLNQKFGNYLPLSGGTISGNLILSNPNCHIMLDTQQYGTDNAYSDIRWSSSIPERYGYMRFYSGAYGHPSRVEIGGVDIDNPSLPVQLQVNGNITANSFIGNLTGNADSATLWSYNSPYVQDFNALNNSNNGLYHFDGDYDTGIGLPPYNSWNYSVLNMGSGSGRRQQLAIPYSTSKMFLRVNTDDNWSDWREVAFTSDIPTYGLRNSSTIGKFYLQQNGADYANVTINLPTALSYFTNDVGYITSITNSEINDRLTTISGMPSGYEYGSNNRGTKIWSNGISFCDPYQGNKANDSGWIRHIEETANTGVLEIAVGDDAVNESIKFRFYNTNNEISKEVTINHLGQIIAANFITSSDKRLKTNINEISSDKLSNSLNLNFYEFDYKDNDNHSAGHVAQEVKEVLPEFVHGNESETEHLSIDYTGLHSVQIKALKNEVDSLKDENRELKDRLKKLEKLVEKLL